MTGRTCPVHGEYSATGICRWCEPGEKYSLKSVDALTHQSFVDRTNQAIADLLGPPPKLLPEWYLGTLRSWLRAPPSWRLEYADPARVVAANFEEEARLASEHAALRWERVARRWEWKHRKLTLLDLAQDTALHVKRSTRYWLEVLTKINPLLQDKPWEPPP